MKSKISSFFTFAILLFALTATITVQAQRNEFYQLKTYIFDTDEQMATTDAYLENAYLPALKRLGIEHVGVFKYRKIEGEETPKKTILLIPSPSLDVFSSLDYELSRDKEHLAAGVDYLKASYDNPPYARIESVLMEAFDDMPNMKPSPLTGPREDRVYELRSYESATEAIYRNKVHMFNEGGEVKLFDDLDFNAVFYADVISGPKMPNLIYMTTHENMEIRDANWKAFGNAPAWKEMSSMSKYQNNVSHADIWLLYPTEYSDY
ncbi:hypothetical protein GGR42_003101 [Saonia flava]|uniref:NIPSNAP domain-containing protein n=1 Tax=Saonia flava TaxID=523696 RepID=A0A846R0C5_9FLAO|nr:NIPSNAP family protein [Saonia flava]NJB72610.1 hypothetical protein [Saonia flava]